ncbi:MAG: S9 family peptidase [Prevotella sp.]|nr:S9 family peptidase [Prevotella sp.]
MRKLIILFMAVMACASAAAQQQLDLPDIGREFDAETLHNVVPIGATDKYASRSADGRQIVERSFNGGQQTAVLFDVETTIGEKISSFDGFTLSADGAKMLIYTNPEPIYRRSFKADYYIYTVRTRKLERLSNGGKQQSPQFSPDGNQIAFVRENNLFLVKMLYDNAESQVTKDGKVNEIINGVPDWVNEEEFGFNCAFCFNADGTKLCWLRYDETAVPSYTLQTFGGDYPEQFSFKYPKAGQANSTVTAWSFDIQSRRIQQLQIPSAADDYLPRIKATDNPDRIVVYTLNRAQNLLSVYTADPSTTLAQMIIQDKAERYIGGDVIPQIKLSSTAVLLPSDRSGYTHLYIYDYNGLLLREVGEGEQIVTDIYAYNDATGDAFCQIADTPFDRYVAVSRKNGKLEALTEKTGWNAATFSGNSAFFLNTWSDMNTPYIITARNAKGKVLATIIDNAALAAKMKQNGWNRREMFSFTTSEGITLNGWMIKPENFAPQTKYPVVMYQYSGPGSQQVVNAWHTGSMGQGLDYYLAQQGYIVVCVDGRGTGGRGREFEQSVFRQLGLLEAKDQTETALWLANQSYVDGNKIGIWGWSYGGFNTLMSMSEGRAAFACGVAVAPVTDWRFYDTIYTERYMRTPQENAAGYDDNPIARADKLSGALLLCAGTGDDNVHPQNMVEYAGALVDADKDFSEVQYANRNHSINGGNARNHLYRQLVKWFDDHLK